MRLTEALKQYLAFLEERGLTARMETVPAKDSLGRISASAAHAKTPYVVSTEQDRSDLRAVAGKMILQSYLEINPEMIAALVAGGVQSVSVLAKPRVGIILASNEERSSSADFDAAIVALYCAMLSRWGAEGVAYSGAGREPDALQPALLRAAQECDFVLLCYHAEQGIPADALHSFVAVCVDGIAIHPGGDILLGAIQSVPVVCASSNPAAGIVVLEELVKPVLDHLLMRERSIAESICVKMGRDYASAPEVRAFVRARLGFDPEGSLCVLPIQTDEIGIETLAEADCILDVPVGCAGYAAGERAHVRLLKPIERIARTIRICGSFEPFLDEAADALRRADTRTYVSYLSADDSHAMEAIQSGECHLCGLLLPDDAEDIAYIEQHNPEGGVALVEGIAIAKDNQAYDFLVSLSAMESPQVRAFLRVLGSEDFLRRLEARGEDRYHQPGRIKKIWP